MKTTVKTLGLLTAISAISVAYAASPRVGIMTAKTQTTTSAASRRLPSIAGYVPVASIVTGNSTGATTSASLLTNAECIENYTSCLKSADACGPDFEECTTNVLLHAQMPKCFSILSQCTASGIYDLFGASDVTALATADSVNTYEEIDHYAYPTNGSVLGQLIIGAEIANRLTTDQCVKKYMNCLHRDNVCGEEFELCTTNNEFKKQAFTCGSVLARCQGEGKKELFGEVANAGLLNPSATSRLGVAITEGQGLAALNAVSTCYKVADQCILNACSANPYKCLSNSSTNITIMVDNIVQGTANGNETNEDKGAGSSGGGSTNTTANVGTTVSVARYIKDACYDVIGGNKYCFAAVEGKMPTSKDLLDEDTKEGVFATIYSDEKSKLKQKIEKLASDFDIKTRDKCINTIKSCVMRTCGEGLGSLCYQRAFIDSNGGDSINGANTYAEIQTGCEAIVGTDLNCQYTAAKAKEQTYSYSYKLDKTVFTDLFPNDNTDPIGVVSILNALYKNSYSQAALNAMEKQCSNIAENCVRSVCGTDFIKCYRNRPDVMSDIYSSDSQGIDRGFANSMNKVGGVLDYTIVTGLCLNTITKANACSEHLKIEAYKLESSDVQIAQEQTDRGNGTGGGATTRPGATGTSTLSQPRTNLSNTWTSGVESDWLSMTDSIKASKITDDTEVVIGCTSITPGCDTDVMDACDTVGTVDGNTCVYDQPVTEPWSEYSVTQSAQNLFQRILAKIEKEVQSKYNAKLTVEQNICKNNNKGGIMGNKETDSNFLWVKLNSNRVPKDYPMKGLKVSQFKETGDLYGAFCRAKVTVVSDDKAIQDNLAGNSVAYFAVGDPFTCGSWISQSTLDKISKDVRKKAGEGSDKEKRERAWWTAGAALLGGIGTFAAVDSAQQDGRTLGGLINPNKDSENASDIKSNAKSCLNEVEVAKQYYKEKAAGRNGEDYINGYRDAAYKADRALEYAKKIEKSAKKAKSSDKMEGLTITKFIKEHNGDEWTNKGDVDRYLSTANCLSALNDCKTKVLTVKNALPTMAVTEDNKTKINNDLTDIKTVCSSCLSGVDVPQIGILKGSDKDNAVATDAYKDEFDKNLKIIEEYCDAHTDVEADNRARRNRNLIAGTIGAAGSGLLAYQIVKSTQNAKYDKAVEEWMEDIGSHIKCYVGGEELGEYGDVIQFELSE